MSAVMTVSDFQTRHDCCQKGIEDGLGFETMREWWENTVEAQYMRWCIEAEYGGSVRLSAAAFIKTDHPKIVYHPEFDYYIIYVQPSDADFMREYVKCPW